MIMRYKAIFDAINKEENYVNTGGNAFIINDKQVMFDYPAFNYDFDYVPNTNKMYVEFESGRGLWDDYEIDECYDEDLEEVGLTRKDLTAEFLASTEKINEIYLCYENTNGCCYNLPNLKFEYIEFEDLETGETYEVNQEVINKYNILYNMEG